MRGFLKLVIASVISSLVLVATFAAAPTDMFQVVGDSAVGKNSLALPGSQDLIRDAFGKYIAVYADSTGSLSTVFANGDPARPAAWSAPAKTNAPALAYRRPALLLTSPFTMRLLAEGGQTAGDIVDIPVRLDRDLGGNIVGITYGSPSVLARSSQYVSASLAHDGSILAVWNSVTPGVSSKVMAMRWTFLTGWTSPSNPSSNEPDTVIQDTFDTAAIQANVIERPDTFAVYVIGNRGERSNLTTLVFNSATFNGIDWAWIGQNLTYETNASRGLADSTDLAWDPVRSVVVVTYDISQTSRYGVIRIDASGSKAHVDTPHLNMTNNEWGVLQVDPSNGDYYLFVMDTPLSPPWGEEYGAVKYTRLSNGVWSSTLIVIDNEPNNMAISPRRPTMLGSADPGALEIVYAKGTTAPATLIFVRLTP